MIGRTYLERGQPATVLVRWRPGSGGPRDPHYDGTDPRTLPVQPRDAPPLPPLKEEPPMPDTEAIALRTDGPHSPEYTRRVGNALGEAVRVLNYATMDGAPGLEYPGDVYDLLAAIYVGTGRLPQLFDQMTAFLQAQAATGALGHDLGEDPNKCTALAIARLAAARVRIEMATRALQAAQDAIAGLYVKDGTDA